MLNADIKFGARKLRQQNENDKQKHSVSQCPNYQCNKLLHDYIRAGSPATLNLLHVKRYVHIRIMF